MRFRHVFMGIGSLLIILILTLTDPQNNVITNMPFGAGTLATLIVLWTSVLYVALLHVSRRSLLDYLDLQRVIEKAMLTPEGAGMVAIAVGLIMISISIVISAAVK